jgi:DNA-directed RNA polymerase specialized sigma24 family protein
MPAASPGHATGLLRAWNEGDQGALEELVPLVEAELRRLARIYMARERRGKSRVVELRFFGGLSVEETADLLHLSNDTIKRDRRLAKLWLLRELEGRRDD